VAAEPVRSDTEIELGMIKIVGGAGRQIFPWERWRPRRPGKGREAGEDASAPRETHSAMVE